MINVILGAGITGLSCAYHLKRDYVVIEKEFEVGGLCRSIKINGFIFDYTGHSVHLRTPYVTSLVKDLLKGNIKKILRRSFVYVFGKILPYPFQMNLSYLDEKHAEICLDGLLKREKSFNGNFYDFCLNNYGDGICKYFMFPYNRKLWKYPLSKLSTDWAKKFIPESTKRDLILSAFLKLPKEVGYNAFFYYPIRNGMQALVDGFAKKISPVKIVKGAEVVKIDIKKRTVKLLNGDEYKYKFIVSTIPLPELIDIIHPQHNRLTYFKNRLKWISLLCFNLGIRRKPWFNFHWAYFPESEYDFYRIGSYTSFSNFLAPKDFYTYYVEVSYKPDVMIEKSHLFERIVQQIKKIKLIKSIDEVQLINILDIKYAYVLHDHEREKVVNEISKFLMDHNIILAGRYGAWKYSFIEECILDGKNAAEYINEKT